LITNVEDNMINNDTLNAMLFFINMKDTIAPFGYVLTCEATTPNPFGIYYEGDVIMTFRDLEEIDLYVQGLIRAYQDIEEKKKQQDPDAAPMKGIIE